LLLDERERRPLTDLASMQKKEVGKMKASCIRANDQLVVILLIFITQAAASAGEPLANGSASHVAPSEISTDCIDREYRGKSLKLGSDYTDLINDCGTAVIITWATFRDGVPQMEEGGMGQSECIPPGGAVTTMTRQLAGATTENLPVSVVTCQ
jgi:hypothetical protein